MAKVGFQRFRFQVPRKRFGRGKPGRSEKGVAGRFPPLGFEYPRPSLGAVDRVGACYRTRDMAGTHRLTRVAEKKLASRRHSCWPVRRVDAAARAGTGQFNALNWPQGRGLKSPVQRVELIDSRGTSRDHFSSSRPSMSMLRAQSLTQRLRLCSRSRRCFSSICFLTIRPSLMV